MKSKLIVASLLFLTGVSANASVFDDSVDAAELANVLFNCPKDIQRLKDLTGGQGIKYVSSVEGQFKQISDNISEKVYVLTSAASTGGFDIVINSSASIRIKLKVSQTNDGGPADTEWTCSKP